MNDDKPNEKNAEAATLRVVACPRCRKSARYDLANPFRPFCSARCKNEDIVSWAQESYRIPDRPLEGEDGDGQMPAADEEDE